ncbi:MAG: helix-turn-helix transcriptional regulator [Gammaproteobacteria bacterium]|nr:helix-turn-helix transcriptional regulator [Gammaproteobacteria bacterium]
MISKKCPLPPLFEKISGKWKLLILYNLSHADAIRFSDLYRSIPEVSQKVLTSQLRDLERDGLVNRQVYPEVPPRVEYSLTNKGLSLCPVLSLLADWATKNM